MRALNGQGLAKAIGVANFYPDRLLDLIDRTGITPAVNQIETHPYFQRAMTSWSSALSSTSPGAGSPKAAKRWTDENFTELRG